MAYIRDFTSLDVVTASTNPSASVVYPTHSTNDIIILSLACDGTNIPALPSGYTNIFGYAGAAQTHRLCYKAAASSSEVCPTLSLSSADEWHIVVIAVAGADYADPINFSANRTATDNAAPFTWTSGASTDENNVLILHFCNSDSGLALTALQPFVNLVNGDCGSAGQGVAYTFQPTSGSITNCTWTGRANDDTTACAVGINDDGNATSPAYAGPSTTGSYISALGGTSLIESDTNPGSLTFQMLTMTSFTKGWSYDGGLTYVDETTDMGSAATADVTITNAINAAWYFGYDYPFGRMGYVVSTALVGGTVTWEYYNGSSWASLSVTGGAFTATGSVIANWTIPSNWTATSVNGTTKYYVRWRITATATTVPILSTARPGGRLTSYDAVTNAADTGVNPYNDAAILSPVQSANPSGSERQFGSSKDMDTGVLVLHHKSVLPRDYAVDPSINDQTYPVNNNTINQALGGLLVVLGDSSNNYEAYSIHGKGAISNDCVGWNVAAIGLNNSALPFCVNGTLNKSAITRMLFLAQGENGAMSVHLSTLLMVDKIVICGGTSNKPITADWFKWVATHCIGVNLLVNSIGTYNRIYAPIQIGVDATTYIVIDGETFAMPTAFDGKDYFDWNAANNCAGFTFYGLGSGSGIKFTNCIWRGTQPYTWQFHASHSTSTAIDFTGSTVDGATVVLKNGISISGVRFANCASIVTNGATVTDCEFDSGAVVDAGSPSGASNITGCTFTKPAIASYNGLTVTGTAADFTLADDVFTGYSGTGSTAAVYVKIATGSLTITTTGNTSGVKGSVKTDGCVVTVRNSRTVSAVVRAASNSSLISGARVALWHTDGSSVTITRASSTATVDFGESSHGLVTGDKIAIFGANQGEYNGIKTVTWVSPTQVSFTVSGTPTTPATGTITAHFIVLDGTTNALGTITNTTYDYTEETSVTGRARYAPSYKTGIISGTITNSGLTTTTYLVSDS